MFAQVNLKSEYCNLSSLKIYMQNSFPGNFTLTVYLQKKTSCRTSSGHFSYQFYRCHRNRFLKEDFGTVFECNDFAEILVHFRKMCTQRADESVPMYWELQTDTDRAQYLSLWGKFHEDVGKSKKGERLEAFTEKLTTIRRFVQRGDENDWRRSLLCGIFFLNDALAINIQQFRHLVGKCKSSINGSLQQLGYLVQGQAQSIERELLSCIPAGVRDVNELKKWTVRKRTGPESVIHQKPEFVISIPENMRRMSTPVKSAEEIRKFVHAMYPCPVKCRYKYYDIMRQTASLQTEA